MSTRRLLSPRLRVALAVLAFAVPGLASPEQGAPVDQYDQFPGEATTIRDAKTGLTWARTKVQRIPLDQAPLYCGSTVFSPDGRVPTVKELLTLVAEDAYQYYQPNGTYTAKAIDRAAFPQQYVPTDADYWTSTPTIDNSRVWAVNFKTGETVAHLPTESLYVRCVKE